MSVSLSLPTLSYQEGRLLMDQRCRAMGVPSVRTIPEVYRVRGPLDIGLLDKALAALAERHEALRTRFPDPYRQIVSLKVALKATVVEVSDEQAAFDVVRAEVARPLPADQPERLRVTAVRVDEDDHFVVLVFDHLVVDAWARGLLMDELSALYSGQTLPEVEYGYQNYVNGQRELLVDGRLMAFWRERLAGPGAIPRLDVAKLPAGRTPEGGYQTRPLPAELVGRVRLLAARERATLFMLVLCALQIALREHTGADDQSVAVNVYNRDTVGQEKLVAPLAELLVVRTDLANALTFRDALGRVRAASLDAQEHGAMPFAELVKAFNPHDYADPDVPIGVVLNMLYSQVHGGGLDLHPATTTPVPLSDKGFRPRSELMLVGEAGGTELTLSAYYQADRLPAEFVTALLDRLVALLSAVVDDPLLSVVGSGV